MLGRVNGSHDRTIVLLFTWAAGSVDAVAYLAAHVFTANMTGNAVLLGISAGQFRSAAVLHSLVAMIAFIAGIVTGTILGGESKDKIGASTSVRHEVIVETVILILFAAVFLLPLPRESPLVIFSLIVLSAIAMGLQSATVRKLHLPGIATTYITGTITSLFSGLVHYWGSGRKIADSTRTGAGLKRFMVLQAEVFISYAMAALVTGALYRHLPSLVAWMPVVAIAGVAASMSRPSSCS